MPDYTTERFCRPGERNHRVALALLFMVGVLNLFDRQLINVLAQDIKTDLHLSDLQLGLLTGAAFGILYSLLGIPLGRLADRVDRVKLIALALVLWSVFTSLCGLAGGYAQLFLARIGVGVGEAASQPASTALIPDLFPERTRTSAMSFLLVGAPVGSFLGLLAGGLIASHWGWRAAFVVAGIPGLMVAMLILIAAHDPRSRVKLAESSTPIRSDGDVSLSRALRTLVRRPGYGWLVLAMVCSVFLVYASGAWLPALFIRVYHMSTADIGRDAGLAVGLGGAAGTLGVGILCDRLRANVRGVESKAMMVMLGLTTPLLLATVLSPERSTALVSMFLFNVCAFAFLGPTVTLTQRAATPSTRALAIAVTTSVANILSLACGLPLVGLLSDRLAPVYGPHSLRYALACGSLAGVMGAAAHWRAFKALNARPPVAL